MQRALSNFYFQGLTFCIFIAILFYKSMLLCSQQEFLSSITDRYIAKISYRKSPAKLKHKSNCIFIWHNLTCVCTWHVTRVVPVWSPGEIKGVV